MQAELFINHEMLDLSFNKIGIDFFQFTDRHDTLLINYYSKYPEIV